MMIYYVFAKNSVYGESWSTYSYIELAGFVLLLFSSQLYNGQVKYPKIFRYNFEEREELKPILESQDNST